MPNPPYWVWFRSFRPDTICCALPKTNTYAKKPTGLQRTLDMFWVVHNFIRKHFIPFTNNFYHLRAVRIKLKLVKEAISF